MKVIIKNRDRDQKTIHLCQNASAEKRIVIPMRAVRENVEMSEKEFNYVKETYKGSLIVKRQAN